jgi:hypothetical protein
MTDTSAGLTPRHIATCGRCGITFGKDEPFFNVFCPECPKGGMRGVLNSDPTEPSEADALLADLRGKLAEALNAAHTSDVLVSELEHQLEAERAKVRELVELLQQIRVATDRVYQMGDAAVRRVAVAVYERTAGKLNEFAALPASVDAKGEDRG